MTDSFNRIIDYIPSYLPEQRRYTAAPNKHMTNSDELDAGEQNQSENDINNDLYKNWM
jgi:hypothetical protein